MKKMLFWGVLFALLCGCSEQGCPNYEPVYLNKAGEDVLILWKFADNDFFDTILVESGDSAYAAVGDRFPLLQENGLRWSEKSPLYDVKLILFKNTDPSRCLTFEGDEFKQRDIRKFSSYENIGECGFCVERGECVTECMLYRITDDMLKEAKPCE